MITLGLIFYLVGVLSLALGVTFVPSEWLVIIGVIGISAGLGLFIFAHYESKNIETMLKEKEKEVPQPTKNPKTE